MGGNILGNFIKNWADGLDIVLILAPSTDCSWYTNQIVSNETHGEINSLDVLIDWNWWNWNWKTYKSHVVLKGGHIPFRVDKGGSNWDSHGDSIGFSKVRDVVGSKVKVKLGGFRVYHTMGYNSYEIQKMSFKLSIYSLCIIHNPYLHLNKLTSGQNTAFRNETPST